MRWRSDREHTATGFWWLDWLTAPIWSVLDWQARRRFYRLFALPGESWKDGRRFVQKRWQEASEAPE